MNDRTTLKPLMAVLILLALAVLPGAIFGMQATAKPTVTVYKSPT
jgi:hypothetical protein